CSILSTGKDRKTPQRYSNVPTTSWRISIRSMDSLQGLTPESPLPWHRPLAPKDLALYDNESWNDPRDFAKPVKAIALPQDVPSTFDRRLIKLKNQVQCLKEAHLAPTQPTQMNKITTSCEICNGPHDTQYCMKNPESTHPYVPMKQEQSEMTNKIDTVLKAITNRIEGTLPSDIVKNPKLGATPVMSARSYPTIDPQISYHPSNSINAIKAHFKEATISQTSLQQPKIETKPP
nr:MAK10-like protein [Tanacetum cinerariifolium]